MTELLRMPIGDGEEGSFVVELSRDANGVQQVSNVGDRVVEAARTLRESLQPITRAAATTLRTLQAVNPSAVEVEFGVRIHAKTGAVVTEAGAEGHLKVKMTWDRAAAAELQGPGGRTAGAGSSDD
ncbi:CU044_2847 family protein [Streptomyces sp. NPDC050145]|uniref:CU044_2847 family protein n=1 Tax=Streptomyces sp. NPDC050145 TaxID=3365602 RepID=UPI0037A79143